MHNESLTSFKWWLKGFSQPKSYASLLKRLKLTDSSPPPSCWTEAKQTLSERHNWPNHSKTTDFLLIFTSIFFKCLISLNGTLLLAKRKFPENPEQVVYIHRKGQIRWQLAWNYRQVFQPCGKRQLAELRTATDRKASKLERKRYLYLLDQQLQIISTLQTV